MKRYIQKHVETLTAKLILEDAATAGDKVLISVENGALAAVVKK